MPTEFTYTSLRENLASVLDQVTNDNEVVIVHRRGAEDVAMLPARELASIMETMHLMRSPRNAARLMKAIERSKRGEGKRISVETLRREVGPGEGR
jgi:antitoxin YefM